jgi:hypothetical protein
MKRTTLHRKFPLVLQKHKADAELIWRKVTEAVITVPAYVTDAKCRQQRMRTDCRTYVRKLSTNDASALLWNRQGRGPIDNGYDLEAVLLTYP